MHVKNACTCMSNWPNSRWWPAMLWTKAYYNYFVSTFYANNFMLQNEIRNKANKILVNGRRNQSFSILAPHCRT